MFSEIQSNKLHPADSILSHLATYSRVWSPLSDVVLVCRDGLLPAHKLVLAALSPLLRSALTEADTWDQENKLSVLMPDFSMLQMSQYFADLWKCSDMKQHSDINFVFGHLSLSSLKTYSVQEEPTEHSHNLVSDVVVEDISFDPANIKVEAIEVSDSVDTETKGSEITSALDYTWVACEVCGKNFPSNGARNKHLAIHREGKHFCKFCGKGNGLMMSATKIVMRNMSMAQVNSYVVNAEKLLNPIEVFATTLLRPTVLMQNPHQVRRKKSPETVLMWCSGARRRRCGAVRWWRS